MHRSSPGVYGGRGASRQRRQLGVSGTKRTEVQMPTRGVWLSPVSEREPWRV